MMGNGSKFEWTGRVDDTADWSQFRVHQVVEDDVGKFRLIGFKSDEGVRRNAGRVGAKEGPDAIRSALANFPWRQRKGTFIQDYGNVVCEGENLEEAQLALGEVCSEALNRQQIPIILGGGHETFYGHYLGVRQYLGPEATIGMINIDAHFDLRSYEEQPSSGTMFRQILDCDEHAGYLVVGIQKYGNTEALFEAADERGVEYVLEEELDQVDVNQVIQQFAASYDAVIVTVCMDVLASSVAPGVSAPSVFGLAPTTVRWLLRTITSLENMRSFDVSEVNPSLDEDGRTAKLAAAFVLEVMMGMTEK